MKSTLAAEILATLKGLPADLIVKVKEPLAVSTPIVKDQMYSPSSILPLTGNLRRADKKGATAIGYETVEEKTAGADTRPMSESLAGYRSRSAQTAS